MSDERGGDTPKSWLNRLTTLLGNDPETRADLLEIIKAAGKKGILDAESQRIIESTLQVSDMQVREIMVPRAQIISIKDNSQPKDFLPTMLESAHSRFPVLANDNSDEVVGILLAKDMLRLIGQKTERFDLKDYIRPAFCIPETAHLDRLLREFKAKQSHMAIAVDEYGGIAGLVTLEDALEQIVGDIHDEHDDANEDSHWISPQADGSYIVQAITPITEFNDYFETQLTHDDFETIGGIILSEFERMPHINEYIDLAHWRFTILAADLRMISVIKVQDLRKTTA
ncbi:MAG: CBS domain-containing protein [Moraxellaceae bacterium]|nr:CBS domain-containing protein [Pseudomonadales bacterium]MCB1673541.1 CBS domain-containing protein [Pseudomonadales bacterium]MCP5173585.1 CBS domain-containing protein [Moraxellaceae bacterium]MCP5177588.1 CBS domain-containing protein [Moraxellaceae bacterium]HQV22044.1 transporter associated domain-containing protein [Agitococcus sp.]